MPDTSSLRPPTAPPRFAVVLTVKNGRPWIERALASIEPELASDGVLVIVDAESTDGTTEWLREREGLLAGRLRLIVRTCSMGVGRHLGIQATEAPIVLTQVDADTRYEKGVLRRSVEALEARPKAGLLLATGLRDEDPDATKVFAWRRSFYLSTPGYGDRNVSDDVLVVRSALEHGQVARLLVDRVGEDLRRSERDAAVVRDPWKKGPGFLRLSRRRYTQGWTWRLYLRFLWATRRTFPRFLAGAALATLARASPAP